MADSFLRWLFRNDFCGYFLYRRIRRTIGLHDMITVGGKKKKLSQTRVQYNDRLVRLSHEKTNSETKAHNQIGCDPIRFEVVAGLFSRDHNYTVRVAIKFSLLPSKTLTKKKNYCNTRVTR